MIGSQSSLSNLSSYQRSAVMRCVRSWRGHDLSAVVFSVSWAPDGKHFVSGCQTGNIALWDAITYDRLHHIMQTGSVLSVAWAPDGQLFASGSTDGAIRLWRVPSLICEQILESSCSDLILSVAWSRTNRLIASCGSDGNIKVWNVNENSRTHEWEGHSDKVSSIAWHPSGNLLASASYDDTLKIWSLSVGNFGHVLTQHCDAVATVAWNFDGERLASGGDDNMVNVWEFDQEPGTLLCLQTLCHRSIVESVAWSPDGRLLAAGGLDGVRLWDTDCGTCLQTLQHGIRVAWSPNGDLAISGHAGALAVWSNSVMLTTCLNVTKQHIEDCFAALLCEWVYGFGSPADAPPSLPRLAIQGAACTHSSVHRVLFPEASCGLTSLIAVVAVEFPSVGSASRYMATYIVFQGSSNFMDWLQNVSVQRNLEAYRAHGVGVHSTFHQEVSNRWILQRDSFEGILESAAALGGEGDSVLITGHSQGGAQASALFGILKVLSASESESICDGARAALERLRLVTFAAPMVFAKIGQSPQSFAHPRQVSRKFLETMRTGRNYIYRNDPIPRAYSKLSLQDYVTVLVQEGKVKFGERSFQLLSAMPVVGSWLISAEEQLQNIIREGFSLDSYAQMVEGYAHFVEIVLLEGSGQSWEVFDMSSASLEDHPMRSYVKALFDSGTPCDVFLPPDLD